MISIPIAFIFSKIYTDPSLVTLDHILIHLQNSNHDLQSNNICEWILEENKSLMVLEMIRVHSLTNNEAPLFELYKLWDALGYTSKDKAVLIGYNDPTKPFNPKVSMFLNHHICGVVGYCPLEVWNTVKQQVQKEK
jgi:hypothetical protein